jgi:hypothetical protein
MAVAADTFIVGRGCIVKREAAHIMRQADGFAIQKSLHKVFRPVIGKFPFVI